MRRRFRLPVFLAAAALLAGCFQVESVLAVRPDGSATLTENISADGMMGLMLRKGAAGITAGIDATDTYGEGVTVRSIDTAVVPGSVRRTTVYEIPDVAQFRYDLSNAFDGDEMRGAMGGGGGGGTFDGGSIENGEMVNVESDTSSFRFAFAPGLGGAASQLRVTSPRMGDITDTNMDLGPLSEMLGGESSDPDDAFQDMMVIMGGLSMRFSVQADAIVDTDGGWTDGDRVVLTDISMGAFLDHLVATGQTGEMRDPMVQGPDGIDLPGYRVLPEGETTIRFQ